MTALLVHTWLVRAPLEVARLPPGPSSTRPAVTKPERLELPLRLEYDHIVVPERREPALLPSRSATFLPGALPAAPVEAAAHAAVAGIVPGMSAALVPAATTGDAIAGGDPPAVPVGVAASRSEALGTPSEIGLVDAAMVTPLQKPDVGMLRGPLMRTSPTLAPPAVTARTSGGNGAAVDISSGSNEAMRGATLSQKEVILEVVRAYTRAYERLDVRAAQAVWPSLDQRGLTRAFQQLDGQEIRFTSCGVSFTGPGANARCLGNATYVPKVGGRVMHLTDREWTFDLAKAGNGWQIVNARMQQ